MTLPYRPEEWEQIDALGAAVDEALEEGDVRLTMGGEPTFVTANAADAEKPEWNVAATGGTKEPLATELTARLADAFTSGALILHGQGKWYPGEPLPRWQNGVYWRSDGHPLWRDRGLLANPFEDGDATLEQAEELMNAIADGLGLPVEVRYPVYEDPVPARWREAQLPGDLPAEENAEIIAVNGDRAEPTGWALPIARDPGDPAWSTGRWHLRRGRVHLVEGESPIGLRLPLKALTHKPAPQHPEQSLFRDVDPLDGSPVATGAARPATKALAEIREDAPITAVCIEVRHGHVHVFLPPLVELAYAAELLGVIENALKSTNTQAVLEGYPPPRDVRGQSFGVAPDPGVIEINIHPSKSWDELREKTERLYAEAEQIGLRAEKFALDGTHTGTGGGAHLTLGGTTPADSPLLRRPELLTGMLTYWQHHPSLSYLFAGQFIGPTSQAPRVDEARHESLYELEIAFSELQRLSDANPVPAWRVDRALRNLLTDLTGNTHRAEFCIDKLYSPDGETGRLGVLELRSFEMPPHPQMALVQALLVRTLVARLWQDPYRAPLVRWGTELHDRFMLPWYCAADIREVLADLRQHDFDFKSEWLRPFIEFRFPKIGEITVNGVSLELRRALEPWNVLGEEPSAGTARYVDSSVERVQVRLDGLVDERHVVTCNGRPVPLQQTDTPGTFVAGVRFQAWQPPSALHPSIKVHSPLTFDLIDRWSGRSLGGCRYHVVHPGGRSYETAPVNAAAAESRRAGRFEALGHSPGTVQVAPAVPSGEYPRTLDLRRPAHL